MDGLDLGSVLLGIGGLVATGSAVLIMIHNARNKGRRSALDEADAAQAELAECRAARVEDARTIYELETKLAQGGK